MSKLFYEFTKNVLLEITRYEKETGEKYDILSEIESKITENPCEYGFTMTDIEKIGLNPMSHTGDTPLGTYFYPLNKSNFRQLISNSLPYASDRKFVGLVKFNFSDKKKWLFLGNDDVNKNTHEDVRQKVISFVNSIRDEDILRFNKRSNKVDTIDESIYNLLEYVSSGKSLQFTKYLRNLGIIGVYDNYTGLMDGNEPSQCAALTPSAYTIVDFYKTSELRHSQYQNKLTNLENFKLIEKYIIKNMRNRKDCKNLESDYFIEHFKKVISYQEDERYQNFCSNIVRAIIQSDNRGCFPGLYDVAIEADSIGALVGQASSITSMQDEYFHDVVKRIITKYDYDTFLLSTFLTNLEYMMKNFDMPNNKIETIRNCVKYIRGNIKNLSPNSRMLIGSIEKYLNRA